MSPTLQTTLQTIARETAPNPDAAVIWMHGLGADANDFVSLVPELDLRSAHGGSLAIRFIFPNAPVMPVTINGGMAMRAWYDILHLDLGGVAMNDAPGSGIPREDEQGLRASQAMVEELVAAQVAKGIPTERILLAGFSQGAAMTMMTGLRHPSRSTSRLGSSAGISRRGRTGTGYSIHSPGSFFSCSAHGARWAVRRGWRPPCARRSRSGSRLPIWRSRSRSR